MFYDVYAKNYIAMCEMAMDMGDSIPGVNVPEFDDSLRKSFAPHVENCQKTGIESGSQHETRTNGFYYLTNRLGTNIVDRISVFKKNSGDSNLPDHLEQEAVVKDKDVKFPSNLTHDIMDHAIKLHNLPLRSSSKQFKPGQNLWKSYVEKHLKRGTHHVYYSDGKNITKTTLHNKDEHLGSYIKSDEEGLNHHMIVSPYPLNK